MKTLQANVLRFVALAVLSVGMSMGQAQAKNIKAGEIFTLKQEKYGKYVVRMRAAKGSGIISNFFTYKNGSEKSDVFWEEIDVEVFGKNGAQSWQSNLITGFGPKRTEGVHAGPKMADGYNTFTLEWTPDYVRWLVNGSQVRRINGGQVKEFNSAASFRFNIWPPNIPEWVGPVDQNAIPTAMFVNWVEYHKWNGGSSFSQVWRDDFNNFNTGRWAKANHTFAENLADFIPQNVVVKNGFLILAMTKNGQTGFPGNPPADGGGSSGGGGTGGGSVSVPSGWTNLKVRHSNKCFDLAGGNTNLRAQYHQWGCSGSNLNQRFKFEPTGDGRYIIRNQRSNRCVDLDSGRLNNGAKIHQWDCNKNSIHQQWYLFPKGGGWFELKQNKSNKCLDISGVSQSNGARVHQWQCVGGLNQQWRFQ